MAHQLPYRVRTDIVTDFVDPLYPDVVWKVTKKCVIDGDYVSNGGAQAHAHSSRHSDHYGVVCIRPGFDSPTLRAHEVAHLLNTEKDTHGKGWRRIVAELGYPEEAERYVRRYQKKNRSVVLVMADGSEQVARLYSAQALDDPELIADVRVESGMDVVAIRPSSPRVSCDMTIDGRRLRDWLLPIHTRTDVRVNDDLTLDMDQSYLDDLSEWTGRTVTKDNSVVTIQSERRRYR